MFSKCSSCHLVRGDGLWYCLSISALQFSLSIRISSVTLKREGALKPPSLFLLVKKTSSTFLERAVPRSIVDLITLEHATTKIFGKLRKWDYQAFYVTIGWLPKVIQISTRNQHLRNKIWM